MPEFMSKERKDLIKLFGGELVFGNSFTELFDVAKEYLRLYGQALCRYKIVDGKKVPFEKEDFLELGVNELGYINKPITKPYLMIFWPVSMLTTKVAFAESNNTKFVLKPHYINGINS